jgi:hypothetical protein
MGFPPIDMAGPGRTLSKIIFWSYERGTVPYDIAVAAILVFVLLTPRYWFHDRPPAVSPAQEAKIELMSTDPATGTQTFHVDARLLPPPIQEPELEHLLHDAVRNNVPDLAGKNFQIMGYTQVLGPGGTVLYYDVSVSVKR